MLRFSLSSLLAVVCFAAVGSAALADATDLWRQIIVTLTIVCLLFASLAAVFSRGRPRVFASGFALTGWVYLAIAFVSVFGLRDDLLTDKAIHWLGETIHKENQVAGASQAYADFDNDGMLDLFVSMGNGTFTQATKSLPNLTSIGHALWTVVVGWLGGVVALWLRRHQSLEDKTSD